MKRARRSSGVGWSGIGTVANPNSDFPILDAKREVLPREFALIQLTAVQIGPSLTAVAAFIRLSEYGESAIGRTWKGPHEPIFEWRGLRRPSVEGRYFAAIRGTQRERLRLHDLARSWLAERCGGFFAEGSAGQPVVDLCLFSKTDPNIVEDVYNNPSEPLRALGMRGGFEQNYVCPSIKGAMLVSGDALRRSEERLQNSWAVIGMHQAVAALNEMAGYGDRPYSAGTLASMFDDDIRTFLLYTAVGQYTDQLHAMYADARDTARTRHGHFKIRQLQQLRDELLTISLDLPAVSRDCSVLWEPWWRRFTGVEVKAVPVSGSVDSVPEYDLLEKMGEARVKAFEQLIAEDATYRDVISTVASLGASVASARLGIRALYVAGGSLVVAFVTLLVTGDPPLSEQILAWFRSL